MAAIIQQLIDKQDTNEIVRDKIAVIIFEEKENQKSLATAAAKDPALWDFDVFVERSRPWEVLTDPSGLESGDFANGLVNIVFDSDSFDNGGSNNIDRQKAKGVFYVDCYAHKTHSSSGTGDELTSKESDRIARLVRNILMFDEYTYLTLRKTVTRRFINKREKLQPDIRQESIDNIIVTRLTLEVDYEELTNSNPTVDLELVYGQCKISDTGQVYFDVNFDYTI